MPEPVLIAVPAFHAGRTLERMFDRIPRDLPGSELRYAVVDDGSTDDTFEAAERVRSKLPSLTLLRHPQNRGYGGAVKTLLSHALETNTAMTVILHADGQYSPEKLPELLAPLAAGTADLVQGSRMLGGGALAGGMPFYKYAANRLLTAVENRAFGMRMAEFHSGYMLYSRVVLTSIPFRRLSDSFDFDLEMLVCARILGLRIAEVAIPTIYAGEVSHLKPIAYGMDVLRVVRRFRRGVYAAMLREPGVPDGSATAAIRAGR